MFRKLSFCLTLTAIAALAQTKPSFEVATIKPAAPVDQAKFNAAVQSAGILLTGPHVDAHRAEYLSVPLRSLLCYAYHLRPDQISGPDWMSSALFDVVGKLPEGSAKADASTMLQSLLEDRFKLKYHHATVERPVLALVVAGKDGLKLKPSAAVSVALGGSPTLKAGVVTTDSPDGSMRMTVELKTATSVLDFGPKGKMTFGAVPPKKSMHIQFSGATMAGFADMLTYLYSGGRAIGGQQVADMTGIQGHYDAVIEISLLDLLSLQGAVVGLPRDAPPDGLPTLTDAMRSLGLKLESRKAPMDQFVVDHIEKTPAEN